MSTADSQMLAAASGVSQNILQEFGHLKLSEKQSLFAARLTIICVSVVGVMLARDPGSHGGYSGRVRRGKITGKTRGGPVLKSGTSSPLMLV